MKYCFLVILCLSSYIGSAQKVRINNIDSIYYYMDTVNTPVKERMWDAGIESTYQYFTIKCPCLKYNAEPTFIYKINDPGQTISKNTFDNLNTVNLVKLISLAKQTTDMTATTLYIYFFIEKKVNSEYITHKVRLITPRKPEVLIDYEIIPSNNEN
jgi:hypothetical protein